MDIQATCIKNEQDAQGHHTATLQFANGKTMTMPSERPFIVGNKYSLDVNGDFVDPNAAKPAKVEPAKLKWVSEQEAEHA
jgi:hypothetical protein